MHAGTTKVSHADIDFRIPLGWKETTAGESYSLGRSFSLYDCYIAESENSAVAELFVTDRIPQNIYGITGYASFYSKNKEIRQDIFEADWRSYFKENFGNIIFDVDCDEVELANGQSAWHYKFSLDNEIHGQGDYLSFYHDGTVYMIAFYYNDETEYDYTDAFMNVVKTIEFND